MRASRRQLALTVIRCSQKAATLTLLWTRLRQKSSSGALTSALNKQQDKALKDANDVSAKVVQGMPFPADINLQVKGTAQVREMKVEKKLEELDKNKVI